MKRLPINFDEVQKAMEDTEREAFEYFLDLSSGEVVVIADDIMETAREILGEAYDDDVDQYDDVEIEREPDVPSWMEDEVELALEIFLDKEGNYVRIPERSPDSVFAAMRAFVADIGQDDLKTRLSAALDGKGSFRKFKDVLGPHPKERKRWYGFSAQKARQEILDWLRTIGIEPEQR